jgi:hypothetical protein
LTHRDLVSKFLVYGNHIISRAKRTAEAIQYLALFSGFGGSMRLLLNRALAAG